MSRQLLICILASVFPIGPAAAGAERAVPQRIASLNLCTDQLLLMLVDRSRIVSVTEWAQDPDTSYMAERAAGLPVNHGLVEEILPLRPDLILAGRYTDPNSLSMLRRLGYPVATVTVPGRIAEIVPYIREVAALVHAVDVGEALIADMQRRIARLELLVAERPPRLAAIYAPNGISAGRNTLLDELLERAGLRNLAAESGLTGYGQLSLEQLLVANPEVLVLDAAQSTAGDALAYRYLRHPALRNGLADAAIVELPPRLSSCAGPMIVDALALLVAA